MGILENNSSEIGSKNNVRLSKINFMEFLKRR